MKTKMFSFFLCIVLMLALAPTAAAAEVPTEQDIADGNVILETCSGECPGHIITGTAVETAYNIQILSGDHKIILKELNLERVFSERPAIGLDPDEPNMLRDLSAIFIDSNVGKVEFSIVGDVKIASEFGISGEGTAISLQGDDDSSLDISARYNGLYANGITIEGGKYNLVTDSVQGPQTHCGIYSLDSLTIKNADVTASAGNCSGWDSYFMLSIGISATDNMTVENSTVKATGGHIDKQKGESYGISCKGTLKVIDSDIIVAAGDASSSCGIFGVNMELEDSSITAESSAAQVESFGVLIYHKLNMKGSDLILSAGICDSYSVGLQCVDDITAENSYISACGDEAAVSMGIFVGNSLEGTNSEITGIGGVAEATSLGVSANNISVNGGMVYGCADECENGRSCGIFLEQASGTPSFKLINANVVAAGSTQSIYTRSEEFNGISYQADENAEPVIMKDLTAKELYFGNQYKVIYDANGRNAEVPEGEAYYYGEAFLINEDVPAAESYEFICWNTEADGSGVSYDPGDEVCMGNMDVELYAMWNHLGGVDIDGDGTDTDTKDQQAPNSPQTGDNSNIGLWLILLIVSATGIVILSVEQKKRKAMN